MFQSVINFCKSVFTRIVPEEWRNSGKRTREESMISDCEEEYFPAKKIRMNSNIQNQDIESSYFPSGFFSRSRTKDNSSQTIETIDLDGPEIPTISLLDETPHGSARHSSKVTEVIDLDGPEFTTISLLDEATSAFDKENSSIRGKYSPNKFKHSPDKSSKASKSPGKGKYSAPLHCRSPLKTKFKHVSTRKPVQNDVQYVGTFPSVQSTSLSPDMLSSNNSRRPLMAKIVPNRTPFSARTQHIMSLSLRSPDTYRNSAVYDFDSWKRYGELLGKVLKSPELFSCSQTSRSTSSRILDQSSEESFASKSRLKLDSSHKRVSAFVDLTKPYEKTKPQEIINLDPDEVSSVKPTISHRRIVSPVNSLSSKTKHLPCVSSNFLPSLAADIEKFKAEFALDRDQLSKELATSSQLRKPFEQALEERLNRQLKITYLDLIEDEVEKEAVKPQLTDDMMSQIINAWDPKKPKGQVLANNFNYQIKRLDLLTLSGLNWLNDEVINFYMELLMARGKEKNFPSVHAFNTFFYPKLEKDGYSALRRWTRKVDIFAQDLIVVPIHLRVHWCLAMIDMKKKTITYFDSMGQANNTCVNSLLKYLRDEHLDKKKDALDTSEWELTCTTDTVPQQMNSCDCGVFACTFAEYTTRQAKYNFSQDDMPYFRRKMTYEILNSKLLSWN